MRRLECRIGKVTRGASTYWAFWVPPRFTTTGKRQRRYFRTRQEAQEARAALFRVAEGREDAEAPSALVQDAVEARAVLDKAGCKLTLAEVARRAVRHLTLPAAGMPLRKFVDDYARVKWDDWGKLSRRNWTLDSSRLMDEFAGCQLADVTPDRLEVWLSRWTPGTRRGIVGNLRPAFNYAVRRGYLEQSPFDRLEAVKVKRQPISIYTPAQARDMLAAVRDESRAGLAILLFAGVRPHEAQKLRWADVRDGFIHVANDVAKTRQARNVEINPTLAAWLDAECAAQESAPICPPARAFERDVREAKEAAGVKSRQPDMARHSFASYWLAANHDEARLKQLLGHSVNSDTLFVHYRAATTARVAAEFWALRPG